MRKKQNTKIIMRRETLDLKKNPLHDVIAFCLKNLTIKGGKNVPEYWGIRGMGNSGTEEN